MKGTLLAKAAFEDDVDEGVCVASVPVATMMPDGSVVAVRTLVKKKTNDEHFFVQIENERKKTKNTRREN